MSAEQYFSILTTLLISKKSKQSAALSLTQSKTLDGFRGRDRGGSINKEEVKQSVPEEVSDSTARHFETVFSKVDSEL